MKLSFSTRGWGSLSWEELVDTALDMKFTGIEVYNPQKFSHLTGRGGPFHKHTVAATVRALRDQKLSVPCFDTSLDISENEENADLVAEVMGYARDARIPYVVCWASSDKEEMISIITVNELPVLCKHQLIWILKESLSFFGH